METLQIPENQNSENLKISPTLRNISPTRETPRQSIEMTTISPILETSQMELELKLEDLNLENKEFIEREEDLDLPSPPLSPQSIRPSSPKSLEKFNFLTSQILTKQKLLKEYLDRLSKTNIEVGKLNSECGILKTYVGNLLNSLGNDRDLLLKNNKIDASEYFKVRKPK